MPCSHGNLSPRELVAKAVKYHNQPYVTLFGHTNEEILEALDLYAVTKAGLNKDQINITREEAKRKVEKVCGIPLGHGNIVDALEALGLIKFDQVKADRFIVNLGSTYRVCIKQDHNIVGIEGVIISLTELDDKQS